MYLIHVIPLARSIPKETLAYFTGKHIAPGTLVSVPVRNKNISALVESVEDAANAKTRIKNASFAVRKAENIRGVNFLLPEFMQAARETARYFVAPTGQVISTMVPKTILNDDTLAHGTKNVSKKPEQDESGSPLKLHTSVVSGDFPERLIAYRNLIREAFAKKGSVFICSPSIRHAELLFERLKKGVEEYSYIFHGKKSAKDTAAHWKSVVETEHPVLIVATPQFLSLPRKDLTVVILDNEHSEMYKIQRRPHIDTRVFAENLAHHLGARFISGGVLLRTETFQRNQEGESTELVPLAFRHIPRGKETVVDMTGKSGKKFSLVSEELADLIADAAANNKHMFLYVARRGVSSLTICEDCGHNIECENCSAPVVLHKQSKDGETINIFICHKCGLKMSSRRVCNHCQGWRLLPLGIGIERVQEALAEAYPETPIFRIDKDTTRTHKQAQKEADHFYASKGGILLGTEMAIGYLYDDVDLSGIVSLDTLFSLPDFRIEGKVLHILLSISSITKERFIIQTRSPEADVFRYFKKGNLSEFYRHDLKQRKVLGYPPFSLFIKISFQGTREEVTKSAERIKMLFGSYKPDIFPAFIERVKGRYTMHALISIPPEKWPEPDLTARLASLSPAYTVRVDPESLL